MKIFTLSLTLLLTATIAIAQPGNGNGNGIGTGNGPGGNGNGNGTGLDNNPNIDQFDSPDDDPDNPVLDAIPVDGGLMLLLAAGAAFGGRRLYGNSQKQKTA